MLINSILLLNLKYKLYFTTCSSFTVRIFLEKQNFTTNQSRSQLQSRFWLQPSNCSNNNALNANLSLGDAAGVADNVAEERLVLQRGLHLGLVDPQADLAVARVLGLPHAEDAPRLQQGRHGGRLGQVEPAQRPLLAYPAVRLVQLAQADLKWLGIIGCIRGSNFKHMGANSIALPEL